MAVLGVKGGSGCVSGGRRQEGDKGGQASERRMGQTRGPRPPCIEIMAGRAPQPSPQP